MSGLKVSRIMQKPREASKNVILLTAFYYMLLSHRSFFYYEAMLTSHFFVSKRKETACNLDVTAKAKEGSGHNSIYLFLFRFLYCFLYAATAAAVFLFVARIERCFQRRNKGWTKTKWHLLLGLKKTAFGLRRPIKAIGGSTVNNIGNDGLLGRRRQLRVR